MAEGKWQRITYMPGTGIGPGGSRVTGGREHIALSRRAAAESAVLLKNDGGLLPFLPGQKIAAFGKALSDYVKGGGGSGDTCTLYVRTLADGLREKAREGKLLPYMPLLDYYEAYVGAQYAEKAVTPGLVPEPELPDELIRSARAYADTALIVISRFSAEGYDRTGKPFDGDFYLSREEAEMIRKVLQAFDRTAVVLNTGGIMETGWIRDDARVRAALLAGQGGMEGGAAAADLLCGDCSPSGHLADTLAESFSAYPSAEHFHDSDDYVEYEEDIYVGYRYFETIEGAASKVVYPFGYGLTYTEFEAGALSWAYDSGAFTVNAEVKNKGTRPGRQVLQVYCSAPSGKLGKAAKVLAGFQKTAVLQPGEAEKICLRIPEYALASYDDTGSLCRSAYVLERGAYRFSAGFNVRDTRDIPGEYRLEKDVILEQLEPRCAPKKLHRRMLQDGSFAHPETDEAFPLPDDRQELLPFDGRAPAERTWTQTGSLWSDPLDPQLMDVFEGKLRLEDLTVSLTDEMKVHLLGGQPNRGPCNTMGIGNIPRFGIPNVMTADGPAGLRFLEKTGIRTTAFPVASLLAQSWDPELLFQVGRAAAEEVRENGVGVWLAPAINIHRNPLCGRNFEYYSEDPLLAGKLAASLIRGAQSTGTAVSVKHFACNNKETNRRQSDSRVSERALREIYLKAFEICVKEAAPMVVMTSYNLVNGVRASENKDLITGILRGEWGFEGLVTTDWYTYGEQYKEINAGNDLKMACGMPEETLKALRDGRLDRAALDASVRRVLELILKLA